MNFRIKRTDNLDKNRNGKTQKRAGGFTLMELMVVIVILGIFATVVTTKVIRYIARAKVVTAKQQLGILKQAVKQYKMDTGKYPTDLMDLIEEPAGVTGWDPEGYLDSSKLPKDPWGNEYNYTVPGENGRPFDIYSLGADGQEGGQGENADIYDSDVSGDSSNNNNNPPTGN